MIYLINVFWRIDCFFMSEHLQSSYTVVDNMYGTVVVSTRGARLRGLSGSLNTTWTLAASPSSSPRDPTQLQRRYNYHRNSWLYFCHANLLKWIFAATSVCCVKKLILLHYEIHRPLQAISFPVA
jgi:hypothetical protein